jgi:hypothetical protein
MLHDLALALCLLSQENLDPCLGLLVLVSFVLAVAHFEIPDQTWVADIPVSVLHEEDMHEEHIVWILVKLRFFRICLLQ